MRNVSGEMGQHALQSLSLALAIAVLAATQALAQDAAAIATAMLPRDLSPWGMFVAADFVVKAVMIGLACASVATWTVWLAKTIELRAAKRRIRASLTVLLDAQSVADGVRRVGMIEGPARELLAAAVAELDQSADTLSPAGVKERIASRLERMEAASNRAIARGIGVLATIGATAPLKPPRRPELHSARKLCGTKSRPHYCGWLAAAGSAIQRAGGRLHLFFERTKTYIQP